MNIHEQVHENYHSKIKQSFKIIKPSNFTYRLLIEAICPYAKGKLSILDIGCGAGTMSLYLASLGHTVTGIDISQTAINACKKSAMTLHLKNATFFKSEFPRINVPSKKFDAIIFTEVIEHLENDKEAISIVAKLLKKGGILIISTPSSKAPLHRLGLTKTFDRTVGHLRRYDTKSLAKMLIKDNFQILTVRETEGIIRNFLFVNPVAGKLVRFLNRSKLLSNAVTIIDNSTQNIFGTSNIIIVAKKK